MKKFTRRKGTGQTRTIRWTVRLSPQEHRELMYAAEQVGVSLGEAMRQGARLWLKMQRIEQLGLADDEQ